MSGGVGGDNLSLLYTLIRALQGKSNILHFFLYFSANPHIIRVMKVDGAKIKLIRESRSLTKKAFAEKAKVSRQAIEAWEQGNVKSFSTLAKIAELLDVPEKVLLKQE